MSISNIDDLLAGVGNSQQPPTPEHKDMQENAELNTQVEPEVKDDVEVEYESDPVDETESEQEDDAPEQKDGASEQEEDEYGNVKERMSKGMKDRLDRKEKQYQRELEQREYELQQLRQQLAQQGAAPQVQQAAKDFKYDPNDDTSWQQQLTEFVKQTVTHMNQESQQREQIAKQQHAEREFAQKFTQGMERFGDFREVVGSQPIDDAMTLALRGMSDPSAFIYAASKRQPQELERIAKLPDPYARMVEMGKLEERMRKNKPATNAPRPLGKTSEDAIAKPIAKQKEMNGDELLAKADAKRLSTVKARHRSNR